MGSVLEIAGRDKDPQSIFLLEVLVPKSVDTLNHEYNKQEVDREDKLGGKGANAYVVFLK